MAGAHQNRNQLQLIIKKGLGTEIAELNPHTLHNSSIQTLFAIEVVIDPLKLLERSSGGQTNLCHRQNTSIR